VTTSRITGVSENISTYDSAGGKDYDDLGTWEAATDNNLVATTTSEVLECYKGNHSDAVDMADAICDGSYFRIIRPASTEMHSGIPKNDGSIVSIAPDVANGYAINLSEAYSNVQDLCGIWEPDDGAACYMFGSQVITARYVGCMAKCDNVGGDGRGFLIPYGILVNCLAYECSEDNIKCNHGSLIYCCSSIDAAESAFDDASNDCTFKNCLASNSGDVDYDDPGTLVTCGDTDGTGDFTLVGLSFVDAANDDYHLAPGSDGINDGTDVSGDGYGDDDIDFQTRGDSWGVGFDEFVPGFINIGDVLKPIESAQINIGDVWKDVAEIYVNIGDVWKRVL